MIHKNAVSIYAFAVSVVVFVWVLCQCARQRGLKQSASGIKQSQKSENQKTATTETKKDVANTVESQKQTVLALGKPSSKEATTSKEKTNTGKSKEKPSSRNSKPSVRNSKPSARNSKPSLRKSKSKEKQSPKGGAKGSSGSNEKPGRLRNFFSKFSFNDADRKAKKNRTLDETQSLEVEDKKRPQSQSRKRKKFVGDALKTAEEDLETLEEMIHKVVDPEKVIKMGNIDEIAEQTRAQRIREIELMPSECEDVTQQSISVKKEAAKVKIVEENCKVYETHPEVQSKSAKESTLRRKKIAKKMRKSRVML
uniref:Uncharacterized protein n=1 Tax=Panagrolaimus sp. JU765 TaxID=591449 RepID=A0AC34QN76_9BILA